MELVRGYGNCKYELNLYEISTYYYQIERRYKGEESFRLIRGIIGTFKQANEVFKDYIRREDSVKG